MKKRTKIFLLIILFILIFGIGLCIFLFKEEDNYKYKLYYNDGVNQYMIKVYENTINVRVLSQGTYVEDYDLEFESDKFNIVYNFIDELFINDDDNVKEINLEYLDTNQELIFNSIIHNAPDDLDKLDGEVDDEDVGLLYTIYSARLNCMTTRLLIYENNIYKFGDKEGTYTYDVTRIIENADKYEEGSYGPFVLIDQDDNYVYLYDDNKELNEFLNLIDVSLDTCDY